MYSAVLSQCHDPIPQVYVIGEVGILEELDLKGIKYMGGPDDAGKKVTLKKGEYMTHDEEVMTWSGVLPQMHIYALSSAFIIEPK